MGESSPIWARIVHLWLIALISIGPSMVRSARYTYPPELSATRQGRVWSRWLSEGSVPDGEGVVILLMGVSGAGKTAVLACSALKRAYQESLRVGPEVQIVYLRGTPQLLQQRLRARVGHFMTDRMLASQLAALEEPEDAVVVDVDLPPAEIVAEIR